MAEQEIAATIAALSGGETETETKPAAEAKPAAETETKPAAAETPAGEAPGRPELVKTDKPGEKAAGEVPAAAPAEGAKAGWGQAFEAIRSELGERCGTAEQMQAQLADAHALYDICSGKADPKGLLELLKSEYPEAYKKVADYFSAGAAEGGPKPAEGAAKTAEAKNPLEERVDRIERERREADFKAHSDRVVKGFSTKVGELAQQAKLSERATARYSDLISQQIGRDPAALKRLEAGNYADVERLFNEYHNDFLEDLKGASDALIQGKKERDRALPKTPAGGAPPAATSPKPMTAEDRKRAVMAGLN